MTNAKTPKGPPAFLKPKPKPRKQWAGKLRIIPELGGPARRTASYYELLQIGQHDLDTIPDQVNAERGFNLVTVDEAGPTEALSRSILVFETGTIDDNDKREWIVSRIRTYTSANPAADREGYIAFNNDTDGLVDGIESGVFIYERIEDAVEAALVGLGQTHPRAKDPMRKMLVDYCTGLIALYASWESEPGKQPSSGRYTRTVEECVIEACGGDSVRGHMLCLMCDHWFNDISSLMPHYGIEFVEDKTDGTWHLRYDVPPAPSPEHWWNEGRWVAPSENEPAEQAA